jgi:Tfp pilus assembly protein PilO
MIGFKNRDEGLASALILLSILILLGSLVVMLFVPKPTTAGIVAGRDRSRRTIAEEIERAKARTKEVQTAIQPRLWTGNPEAITASVLAQLTKEAAGRKLQIGAFRPQRTQELPSMMELPFSVQVSGPYPAVRSFMSSLDVPGSKIALRSLQISSSDAATSAVTATLGLSVYLENRTVTPEKTESARPASGGTRG